MTITIKNIIKLGVVTATSLLTTSASLASDLESMTSVRELQKLQALDGKYQDLQYLAQRYNCTTEFDPNNRPVTRYEFAVAINSCWQQLENSSSLEDITIWRRLKAEFAAELAQLKNEVTQVETNLTQLESQQFSTTTKLEGQVLFFVADSFGNEDNSETFTGYRTRIDFNTSFSGHDLLKIRLESRDVGRLDDVTGTSLSRLSVDGSTEDGVELSEVSYTFTPSDSTIVTLGCTIFILAASG